MANSARDSGDSIRTTHRQLLQGAGGTPGGLGMFAVGFVLAAVGTYLFLHSVNVSTAPQGYLSGYFNSRILGTGHPTSATGVLFVPFFLGVAVLFYDAKRLLGWVLFYLGLAIIMVEILSCLRFFMSMPVSHLLMMLAMIAGGVGLMLRSLRDVSTPAEAGSPT